MNDDLISRSALLAELNDDKYTWEDYDNVDFAVKNLPAVDAVEVIHCKDCKHLMFSDCYGECRIGHMGIVQHDDFCSRGERRAEDLA